MAKYTKDDILRIVKDEDVEFIRMQFTDIFGMMKNVAITSSQIEKALNNQIAIDGSSIEGFTRIHESDQYLHPDLDTFVILPWRPQHGKVARFICDVYNPDGTPFVGDPRGILKRTLKRAEAMGFDAFNVGPECEFFLFETDEEGHPTTKTADEAGYFDLAPLDHGSNVRREICLALEQMGFEIEASHHEVAEGQHEIDFKYADALTAADNIMTFKMAVKVFAQQHGLHATFMPKPIFGINRRKYGGYLCHGPKDPGEKRHCVPSRQSDRSGGEHGKGPADAGCFGRPCLYPVHCRQACRMGCLPHQRQPVGDRPVHGKLLKSRRSAP